MFQHKKGRIESAMIVIAVIQTAALIFFMLAVSGCVARQSASEPGNVGQLDSYPVKNENNDEMDIMSSDTIGADSIQDEGYPGDNNPVSGGAEEYEGATTEIGGGSDSGVGNVDNIGNDNNEGDESNEGNGGDISSVGLEKARLTRDDLIELCMPDLPYDSDEQPGPEIELANGFTLIVEPSGDDATRAPNPDTPFIEISPAGRMSIASDANPTNGPTILPVDYPSIPKISYDRAKVAFLSPFEWEAISKLYIFDTESNLAAFSSGVYPVLEEAAFPDINDQATPTSISWLDNRHLLVVVQFAYGTVTVGGDVYLFDTEANSSQRIVASTNLTGVRHVTVKDGSAIVYAGEFIDGNFNEISYYSINLPVSVLYGLIADNDEIELAPQRG
ncbi:MAG: DUF4652 domain-containing protein [Oscillospiraceae bacterium]|nr:DUF4652 domain-containing protein [Oscillospiraceae bacterium]